MYMNVMKGTTARNVPTGAPGAEAPEGRVIARGAMVPLGEDPAGRRVRALDRDARRDRQVVVKERPQGDRQAERIAEVIADSPAGREETDDLTGTATDARLLRHCPRLG